MKLSLVIPCYNEEKNVRPMYDAVNAVFGRAGFSYEMIFVNDGSRDGTWKELKKLQPVGNGSLKCINFSRNFGKEAAMYAGLKESCGDYVTMIDADLQQRPEIALEMVEYLDAHPDTDCVTGFQKDRNEGIVLRFFKYCFYGLINAVSEVDFHQGASDFRTFRRNMADAILSLGEYYRFSKGIFSWVGFENHFIPYKAETRNAGKTTWSFRKLFKYAVEGIVAFTTKPLRIATGVGILMSLLSLLYLIIVVVQKLTVGIDVPGYATLIVLILLIGGIQMTTLGIVGEYIAKIYIQGKERPIYIMKEMTCKPAQPQQKGGKAPETDGPVI